MKAEDRVILLMLKYPEEGKVKKRIAKDLGMERAVSIYRNFVSDLLKTLDTLELPLVLCVHPGERLRDFKTWLGENRHYLPQEGRDLGERMKNAFRWAFCQGRNKAVLIGSDIPDLPGQLVKRTLEALEDHDTVLGPAADGGYYLLGFREEGFLEDVFRDMPWSTDAVFGETLVRLHLEERRVCHLPVWSDMDTVSDLKELLQKGRDGLCECMDTLACLEECSEALEESED